MRTAVLLLLILSSALFVDRALAVTSPGSECADPPDFSQLRNAGWGGSQENKRFLNSEIDQSNVHQLALQWAFALDDNQSPHSYPVVTGDSLIVGTTDGNLYALDRATGCVRWVFAAGEEIRSGISYGRIEDPAGGVVQHLIFFGTGAGNVYAVDGRTGEQVWKSDIKDHPYAVVTGTPTYHQGRLFVPVSSMEVALAMNPFYGCCKFRGSLMSLDALTGTTNWRTHVIDQEPEVTGRHYIFVEEWGPSGAPVWSSPTVAADLGLVFVGTGENYTQPATKRSDAIVAFDVESGEIRWSQQYTAEDAFNISCLTGVFAANCPENWGPDLDFGAPPIVSQTPDGRPILLAGQKSGGVYGLDPVTGERIWENMFGRGGMLGGVHWGMAVNEPLGLLFAPISDVPSGPVTDREQDPGLNAVDIATGETRWSAPNVGECEGRENCRPGLSAAILATDELVFAGALDGYLRAYRAATGEVLWQYDTWREFTSVNGLPAEGGAIDVHGPVLADDWLFVQSGYGSFGQKGGNVLLAFRVTDTTGPVMSDSEELQDE
jgi:polyvinyl alcohol dehydrogenase (cytochrome)